MSLPTRSAALVAATALALCLAPVAATAQPCPGQGTATLAITSPEPPAPGRRVSLEVTGAPSRPFAVAADVGAGPVFRPSVGTICLDLGPALVVLYNGFPSGSPTLDATGRFAFDVTLPPRAVLGGRTFYMQAFVMDAAAPNGVAISPRLDLGVERAVVETFSTVASRDAAATTAAWPGDGFATGVFRAPRTVAVSPNDTNFNLPQPLTNGGNRIQFLFTPSQIGTAPGESILLMHWGPRSNYVFASSYAGVELLLAHSPNSPNGLSGTFANNFAGPPVQVFSGNYEVPNSLNSVWYPWPQFTTDFEHDGTRNVVLDVNVPPGASTYQLFRNASLAELPKTRIFGSASSPSADFGEFTTYHTRFTVARIRSIAQSTFYDTGTDNPDYSPVALRVASLPDGAEVAVQVEGAEDANRDGVPDPGTLTGFRSNANAIDGSRLVRFRIGFRASPTTGAVARVTSVSIPYR